MSCGVSSSEVSVFGGAGAALGHVALHRAGGGFLRASGLHRHHRQHGAAGRCVRRCRARCRRRGNGRAAQRVAAVGLAHGLQPVAAQQLGKAVAHGEAAGQAPAVSRPCSRLASTDSSMPAALAKPPSARSSGPAGMLEAARAVGGRTRRGLGLRGTAPRHRARPRRVPGPSPKRPAPRRAMRWVAKAASGRWRMAAERCGRRVAMAGGSPFSSEDFDALPCLPGERGRNLRPWRKKFVTTARRAPSPRLHRHPVAGAVGQRHRQRGRQQLCSARSVSCSENTPVTRSAATSGAQRSRPGRKRAEFGNEVVDAHRLGRRPARRAPRRRRCRARPRAAARCRRRRRCAGRRRRARRWRRRLRVALRSRLRTRPRGAKTLRSWRTVKRVPSASTVPSRLCTRSGRCVAAGSGALVTRISPARSTMRRSCASKRRSMAVAVGVRRARRRAA